MSTHVLCSLKFQKKNQSDAELRHLEVFVRWADVLVLVYSVTDRASFSLALQLLEQVKEFASFLFIGKSLTSSSSSSHFRHPPISAPETPDPPEPPPAAAAAAAAPAAGPQPRKEPRQLRRNQGLHLPRRRRRRRWRGLWKDRGAAEAGVRGTWVGSIYRTRPSSLR